MKVVFVRFFVPLHPVIIFSFFGHRFYSLINAVLVGHAQKSDSYRGRSAIRYNLFSAQKASKGFLLLSLMQNTVDSHDLV
jgi:hypothetical protein